MNSPNRKDLCARRRSSSERADDIQFKDNTQSALHVSEDSDRALLVELLHMFEAVSCDVSGSEDKAVVCHVHQDRGGH